MIDLDRNQGKKSPSLLIDNYVLAHVLRTQVLKDVFHFPIPILQRTTSTDYAIHLRFAIMAANLVSLLIIPRCSEEQVLMCGCFSAKVRVFAFLAWEGIVHNILAGQASKILLPLPALLCALGFRCRPSSSGRLPLAPCPNGSSIPLRRPCHGRQGCRWSACFRTSWTEDGTVCFMVVGSSFVGTSFGGCGSLYCCRV